MASSHEAVLERILALYAMLFEHGGYGDMSIEIRYLRKSEKEVLVKCGKQYRFVVPADASPPRCWWKATGETEPNGPSEHAES
jgi:hypothetical protein